MSLIPGMFTFEGRHPLLKLLVAMLIILLGGVFLFITLLWACTLLPGVGWSALIKSISDGSGQDNVTLLRLVVIVQDISLFIIPGILILIMMRHGNSGRTYGSFPHLVDIVLVVLLGFCIFPVTSFTGQLNSALHLPDWLSGVEKWMIQKEDQADNVIDILINPKTSGTIFINLLVIAVLPAIGEELIFRGVFQRILAELFRSSHLGIWITAILFSTLHFQFFGFLPRLILGLIFGYLFYWGRTLWLPIISHFVNNAVPVLFTYIQGNNILNDQTSVPLSQQFYLVPLATVFIFLIMYYFKNKKV